MTRPRWLTRLALGSLLVTAPTLALLRVDAGTGTVAADRSLHVLTALVLPALGLATFASLPGDALSPRQASLVRYGLDRRRSILRSLARRTLLFTLIYSLLAGVFLVLARSPADPQLTRDLVATLPVAALCALCVSSLFAASVLWGGHVALGACVGVCWIIGHLDGPLAAAVPIGHMRHLLGLGEPLPGAPWLSTLVLSFVSLLLGGLIALRVPR